MYAMLVTAWVSHVLTSALKDDASLNIESMVCTRDVCHSKAFRALRDEVP